MELSEIANTLTSTPVVLGTLLAPIDPQTLRTRPAEGEWCPLEVIGHLIACDSGAFRNRITGILEGEPRIAPFDPWEAINARDFAAEPLDVLLDELAAERSVSSELLLSLADADLTKTALFKDEGSLSAADFVHEWPFHDQEHIQQILASTKLAYLAGMTPLMRDALQSS